MPDIRLWQEIEADFQDGVLLGNGASMAVHPGFGYGSLFSKARELGLIAGPVAEIFHRFETNDFELVLRRLWYAKLVNEALDIPPGAVEHSYEQVRNALIGTVRATHVTHEEAEPHLILIYRFLSRFNTVISLNYDLILYWASMLGNRELGRWFKDCFQPATFREDWETLRRPFGAAGATLFFYPHGNLALIRTPQGSESKVAGGDFEPLLDAILDRWQSGTAAPLFICEGTSAHKKRAIESAAYLQRVFREVLPTLDESLVIYGWSMSDQDEHILHQLQRSNVIRVAVSVRDNDQAYAQRAEERMRSIGIRNVVFFDSASPGCWNNNAN